MLRDAPASCRSGPRAGRCAPGLPAGTRRRPRARAVRRAGRGCGCGATSPTRPCGCCTSRCAGASRTPGPTRRRSRRPHRARCASSASSSARGQPARRIAVLHRCGSWRIASALLGEKHRAAASRNGSQAYCKCSRGATRTRPRVGKSAGSARPNQCSMFRSTPARSDDASADRSSYSIAWCQSVSRPSRAASIAVSSPTSRMRGLPRRLVECVDAAGDRLPVTGAVGALEQQHAQVVGVDHDEHRSRDLERARGVAQVRSRRRLAVTAGGRRPRRRRTTSSSKPPSSVRALRSRARAPASSSAAASASPAAATSSVPRSGIAAYSFDEPICCAKRAIRSGSSSDAAGSPSERTRNRGAEPSVASGSRLDARVGRSAASAVALQRAARAAPSRVGDRLRRRTSTRAPSTSA